MLLYGFTLYASVNTGAERGLTLPLQLVAVIYIVMTRETLSVAWLTKRLSIR